MANLSQMKRERMLAFLDRIREEHKDDDKILTALGEIENELTSKKYGLVWEKHEEAVDVKMQDNIPVFTEVTDKEIYADAGGNYNFLLEGDNLHSLRLLEKTHLGKIDVIYIDPPYNTGSKDFKYNDNFVDKLDGYKHSKWLSFMEKRLIIAEKLLSDKGAIFISIDDNEEAPLKMLCDEIFGEECFIANISWQRTYSPRNDSKGLSSEVEHILLYSSNTAWNPNKLERTEKMDAIYKSPDHDPKPWTSSSVTAPDAVAHQGMVYGIQHPFSGEIMYPTMGRHWALSQEQMLENMNIWAKYKLVEIDDTEKRASLCGISVNAVRSGILAIMLDEPLQEARKKAQAVLEKGNWPYFYFTNKGKGGMRRKTYLEETDGRMPTNLWSFDEVGHTDGAKKELKAIFDGNIPFDTPKPIALLERIIHIASSPDSIILDFFAGSGTTAHAVLMYNATHKESHRKFILCTNNENGICENVTYTRISNVINGYSQDKAIPANLKYYRTDFVSKDSDDVSAELLKHITEMVQLEHGIKIDKKEYLIVLSDDEADELEQHWNRYTNIKALYISKDVLLTTSQNTLFGSVPVHIIPDYYFKFELREVGEAW